MSPTAFRLPTPAQFPKPAVLPPVQDPGHRDPADSVTANTDLETSGIGPAIYALVDDVIWHAKDVGSIVRFIHQSLSMTVKLNRDIIQRSRVV